MEPNLLTTIKNSINKKLLYIILALILIPLVLLIIFRFTPKNMLISNLNDISKQINKHNISLNKAIKDKSIDTASAKEILSDGIKSLDILSDDLDKLETSEDTLAIKTSFKKVLNENITLFEVSLSILNDPSSENIKSKYKTLTTSLDEFLEKSTEIEKHGISYSLPEESLIFFNNLKSYTNAIIKVNLKKDIESEQKRDFLYDINICFTKLTALKKDLKPIITSIKKDNRNLSVVIDNINTMKSNFSELKKTSQSFSIPTIGKDCYSSLEDTIKLLSIYLDSIENAVMTDIDNGDNSDSSELYASAYSKYDDFIGSLDRLSEQISLLNK